MVKAKPQQEKQKEKTQETTEEFAKRLNQQGGSKPNGLRRRTKKHHYS